nr:MAG TPA: hypothetical protein [Caudoviricetes sp.]
MFFTTCQHFCSKKMNFFIKFIDFLFKNCYNNRVRRR